MFSKKWISKVPCIFLLTLFCFVCSCAEEEVPYSEPPNLKLGGPGRECLNEVSGTVDDYITGNLNDQGVVDFWDCLDGALLTFTDYTKGRSSEVYTAVEIRAFLAKFFLGDIKINDSMLASVMQIKRVLVGGSLRHFERREIDQAQLIIKELKTLTLKLNPHISVYYRSVTGRNPEKSIDPLKFDLAMDAFHKGMLHVGAILARQKQSYSFAELEIFLKELYFLIRGPNADASGVDTWLQYLPLLRSGKALFAGGRETEIGAVEWKSVFFVFSQFVQTLARVNVYVTNSSFGDDLSLLQMRRIFRSIDSVMLETLARHSDRLVPFAQMDSFIESVGLVYGFPLKLTSADMKEVVRTLVRELFTPFEIDSTQVEGLGDVQWSKIKAEYLFWADSQYSAIQWARDGSLSQSHSADVYNEWMRIAGRAPWALKINEKGVLVLDWKGSKKYDLKSLTTLNWQKSIIRVFISRFAEDEVQRKELLFLNQAEILKLQQAIEPIGVALGLFEKGDTSLAMRIIREASLFMPRSDGDQAVTYEEGVEYLMSVLSGLHMEIEMFDHLQSACPIHTTEGGRPRIEAPCFRREVASRLSLWLEHLPHMKAYFSGPGGPGLWARFSQFQEETVRVEGYSQLPISRSDVMEMWILLQYIEIFFARFDQSVPEGTLNVADSLKGYVIYSPYLANLLQSYPLNASQRRALFTYLMKYGKIHFFDDALGGSVRFVWWHLNENIWQYETDRLRLVQILASLSSFQRTILGLPLLQHQRLLSAHPTTPFSVRER